MNWDKARIEIRIRKNGWERAEEETPSQTKNEQEEKQQGKKQPGLTARARERNRLVRRQQMQKSGGSESCQKSEAGNPRSASCGENGGEKAASKEDQGTVEVRGNQDG
jgi:hypothetical protein